MRIRVAAPAELLLLQDIERAAGEAFRPLGMVEIADDEPLPLDVLESYRRAGRAWVAVDATDRPVAYLLTDTVDGAAHIEQVSVHPDAARRGVGRALIEHLAGAAREQGLTALTLTTFAEVPWNAPYYTRLGFRRLDEDDPALTEGLRAISRAEAAHGLAAWPRVCMRRELATAGATGPGGPAGHTERTHQAGAAGTAHATGTAHPADTARPAAPARTVSPPRSAPAVPPSAPSR
ncbi:GNAT family N-acetyltransferase [Streptomyces sp. NPDC059071]|uniref:GNAT family N-acetyltransferase n=1 Tax=unclassified Streptomyces TaxID=2593676 RepID=UPI003667EDFC